MVFWTTPSYHDHAVKINVNEVFQQSHNKKIQTVANVWLYNSQYFDFSGWCDIGG